jgi:transposase
MVLDGPTDGVSFRAYVELVLGPTLGTGDIVIIDNLASHRSDKVRRVIEARGTSLLLLSMYSPNLTPIENAFAKLKAGLRRAAEDQSKPSGIASPRSTTPTHLESAPTTSRIPDMTTLSGLCVVAAFSRNLSVDRRIRMQ